jgi:dTDP-4-amino-4,6-dideoxygalactose transaminase
MEIEHNYLPGQYEENGNHSINHNYLGKQFSDYKEIINEIEKLVKRCDYTLGKSVDEFEDNIKKITGSQFAIGVGSGTDALFLSLKAVGIDKGDEVITTPYTFFATIGAIFTAGATPVFVDIREDYNINPNLIEKAITKNTKCILPVHWAGLPCEMDAIMDIAKKNNLFVIEDACHTIRAEYKKKNAGTFGLTGCFSMHPLKNLNVWGDGGYIITDSEKMHDKLVLMRNHGLINRDECSVFAYNSRLDSIQAIVANHLLKKIDHITESRIAHAALFDKKLTEISQIKIPQRFENVKQVYHLYIVCAEQRTELKRYLNENQIDAKVHYPIPMHLQPAAKSLGYKRGDLPVCERICDSVISFPVHEFITDEQIDYIVSKVRKFYAKS